MPEAEKPYWLRTEEERRQESDARHAEWDRREKQEYEDALLALSTHPGGDGLNVTDPEAVVAFIEPLDEKTRRGLSAALGRVHHERVGSNEHSVHQLYGGYAWWVSMWVIALGTGSTGSIPRWSDCLGVACRTAPESWDVLLRALRLRPPSVRSAFVRPILGSGYLEVGRAALVDAAVNAELLAAPDSVRFRAGTVLGAALFWDKDWWWSTPSTRVTDVLKALSDPEVATTLKVTKSRVFAVADLVKSGRLPRRGLAESCLTVLAQSLEPNAATLPRNALEALELTEAEITDLASPIIRMITHGDSQSALLGVSWARGNIERFRTHAETLRSGLATVARVGTKAGAEAALACAFEVLGPDDQGWVLVAALENRNDTLGRRALKALASVDREGWPSELQDALAEVIAGLPPSLREQAQGLIPLESRAGGGYPVRASAAVPEVLGHPYPRTRVEGFATPAEFVAGVVWYASDPTDPILAARILDGISRWNAADLGAGTITDLKERLEARAREESGIHAFDGDGEFAWMLARWLRGVESFRSVDELASGLERFLDGSSDSGWHAMIYEGVQRWDLAELDSRRGAELRARLARAIADRLEGGDRDWVRCAQTVHRWLNEPSYPSGVNSSMPCAGAPRTGGIAAVTREPLVDLEDGPPVGFSFHSLRSGRLDESYVLGWAPRRPSLDLPSWSTGHIDPTDLLDRLESLEAGGEFSVGEFEIWHALLRLDLTLVDARCIERAGALTSEVGRVVGEVISGSVSSPLARQILRVRETHVDGLSVVAVEALPPWPVLPNQEYHVHVTRIHGRHPSGAPWTVGFAATGRWEITEPTLGGCERILDRKSGTSVSDLDWTAVTIPSQRGLLAVAPLVATYVWRSDEGRVSEQVGALNAFLRNGQMWGPLEADVLARLLTSASSRLHAAPIVDILPTLAAAGVPALLVGTCVAARTNQGLTGIAKAGHCFGAIASDPTVAGWVVEWCSGVIESLEGTPAGVLEVLRAWETAALTAGWAELEDNAAGALRRLAVGGSQRATVARRILALATP